MGRRYQIGLLLIIGLLVSQYPTNASAYTLAEVIYNDVCREEIVNNALVPVPESAVSQIEQDAVSFVSSVQSVSPSHSYYSIFSGVMMYPSNFNFTAYSSLINSLTNPANRYQGQFGSYGFTDDQTGLTGCPYGAYYSAFVVPGCNFTSSDPLQYLNRSIWASGVIKEIQKNISNYIRDPNYDAEIAIVKLTGDNGWLIKVAPNPALNAAGFKLLIDDATQPEQLGIHECNRLLDGAIDQLNVDLSLTSHWHSDHHNFISHWMRLGEGKPIRESSQSVEVDRYNACQSGLIADPTCPVNPDLQPVAKSMEEFDQLVQDAHSGQIAPNIYMWTNEDGYQTYNDPNPAWVNPEHQSYLLRITLTNGQDVYILSTAEESNIASVYTLLLNVPTNALIIALQVPGGVDQYIKNHYPHALFALASSYYSFSHPVPVLSAYPYERLMNNAAVPTSAGNSTTSYFPSFWGEVFLIDP